MLSEITSERHHNEKQPLLRWNVTMFLWQFQRKETLWSCWDNKHDQPKKFNAIYTTESYLRRSTPNKSHQGLFTAHLTVKASQLHSMIMLFLQNLSISLLFGTFNTYLYGQKKVYKCQLIPKPIYKSLLNLQCA